MNTNKLNYQTGFGNYFATEAKSGALPEGQNSPQKHPYGLYAEQLSGSAFTTPNHHTLKTWLYRILPSAGHSEFVPLEGKHFISQTDRPEAISPNQLRWDPLPLLKNENIDFIDGIYTYAINGSIANRSGAAAHLYSCNTSMQQRFFYNADGEMLIVLQQGNLRFRTEMGLIDSEPGEIVVIPRGVKFQVELLEKTARGYICENYGAPFTLPERGPIGANSLANERDFNYPQACFENKSGNFYVDCKFLGNLWRSEITHSPLNVVAWHGNYAPYKYALKNFNTINTVSFDHPDPSIFTVLTSQSNTPGVANVDFVIFPERWMVAEHTFRPPYYHRNIMSEFMGLIYGDYDAKREGFAPGGASLHNCMSAHGPDVNAYNAAIKAKLEPVYYKNTLAFMFESCFVWQPTTFALSTSLRQKDYINCWQGLKPGLSSAK